MKPTVMKWGVGGIAALLGAMACSGTSVNNVGELNSGGSGGNASAGGTLGSGNAAGSGNGSGTGNSAGSGEVSPGGGGATGTAGGGHVGVGGSGVGGNHTIPVDDAGAGAGGEPAREPIECPEAECTLVASDSDIRGIAANDTKVFWVDYGTSDALGNYDGQLKARDLTGGATTVLASGLPGPESVSLSSQYAYVFVDQRTEPAHALGVVRVPLGGGAVQPLQSLTPPSFPTTFRVFASTTGYEYWNWNGAVYRVAETGTTVEMVLAARDVSSIGVSGSLLYFQDPDGIWSVPLAGGTPTLVFGVDPNALILQLVTSDSVYAWEVAGVNYLTRMPKAGGAWTRVANLGQNYWSQFALDDAGQFLIDPPSGSAPRILQGSLTVPGAPITLVSEQGNQLWWQAWAVSSVGVFVADSSGLYLTPTASP